MGWTKAQAPRGSKLKKLATKKGGLGLYHILQNQVHPVRLKSTRNRKPPSKLLTGATDEDLMKFDPHIDSLQVPQAPVDDFDWVQNVPGRPRAFPLTWSVIYMHRVPDRDQNGKVTGFQIACGEPGCPDGNVKLNSHLHEENARSTPHGQPRKPPVCHDVSWAALEVAMLRLAERETQLKGKPMVLNLDFIRAVCWEPANLHPGHNGCNAAGVKTTAQTVKSKELAAADLVIDKVRQSWPGSIWLS